MQVPIENRNKWIPKDGNILVPATQVWLKIFKFEKKKSILPKLHKQEGNKNQLDVWSIVTSIQVGMVESHVVEMKQEGEVKTLKSTIDWTMT